MVLSIILGCLGVVCVVLLVPPVRRPLLSRWLMPWFSGMLPRLGETERVALAAGTVWWDAKIFSGKPDWKELLDFRPRELTEAEREFLDGPVTTLCEKLDDWKVNQDGDLPPAVWSYIKKHRFLGMIIPREHGGLGFSAYAHAQVITKLSSRSVAAAVTVMVPNSLGPAELILRYGTDEQKRHFLPRLASGDELPCFALTGPEAGSDAAATQSVGIVCIGHFGGKEVLGMRLTWNKRYITLAPVASLIGLAFVLRDPDGLLGGARDLGITCALVPAHLPGITIGKRHDPMGVAFLNGPITGTDVFVPLDTIIGGRVMVGKGWRMLMESLGAGRGISLPSLAVGGAQLAARLTGEYATVREQFDTPIGRFEGVEEPLARIGGLTYLMTAARRLTLGAIDAGERPAVLTGISKAYLTEAMRTVVNDAMDIRAGSGIMEGPRNPLSRMFRAVPIGITVEGANILTRAMIIYGQGAIRCHPYVQREMRAVADHDLVAFDKALFGHLAWFGVNAVRTFVHALTGGVLAGVPNARGFSRRAFGRFSRCSAAFVLMSDVAMMTLGGSLKRHEKISGRLADALAWIYLGAATLKKFNDEGGRIQEAEIARWATEHALMRVQEALVGVCANLPSRPAAWLLRFLIFPFGARFTAPSDKLGAAVARSLLEDHPLRAELTQDIFVPPPNEPGLGQLEAAVDGAVQALVVEAKIRDAARDGRLEKGPNMVAQARARKVISEVEYQRVLKASVVRDEVIQVDAFTVPATKPVVRPS